MHFRTAMAKGEFWEAGTKEKKTQDQKIYIYINDTEGRQITYQILVPWILKRARFSYSVDPLSPRTARYEKAAGSRFDIAINKA